MDFQYLILVGDDLQAWALDRLDDLTVAAEHIRILSYPPHPHRQIALQVILDHVDTQHSHSIQFRLDDGAVHRTFVERLKSDAAAGLIDYANKPRFALVFARGYAIQSSADGLNAKELVLIYGSPNWPPCSKHLPRIRS